MCPLNRHPNPRERLPNRQCPETVLSGLTDLTGITDASLDRKTTCEQNPSCPDRTSTGLGRSIRTSLLLPTVHCPRAAPSNTSDLHATECIIGATKCNIDATECNRFATKCNLDATCHFNHNHIIENDLRIFETTRCNHFAFSPSSCAGRVGGCSRVVEKSSVWLNVIAKVQYPA